MGFHPGAGNALHPLTLHHLLAGNSPAQSRGTGDFILPAPGWQIHHGVLPGVGFRQANPTAPGLPKAGGGHTKLPACPTAPHVPKFAIVPAARPRWHCPRGHRAVPKGSAVTPVGSRCCLASPGSGTRWCCNITDIAPFCATPAPCCLPSPWAPSRGVTAAGDIGRATRRTATSGR